MPKVIEDYCYACLPANAPGRLRRVICTKRGSHRPSGEAVPHESHGRLPRPVFMCRDCGTLVVDTVAEDKLVAAHRAGRFTRDGQALAR